MEGRDLCGIYPSVKEAEGKLAENGYTLGSGGGRRYKPWWNKADLDPLLLFRCADGSATITRYEYCE